MKKRIVSFVLSVLMTLSVFTYGLALGGGLTVVSDAAGSVSMWFDHTTAKTALKDTASTGMTTYHMYMAKNEIEGCQFLVSATEDMEVTVEASDFVNAAGDILETELYYALYFTMITGDKSKMPDAIPPVDGPVEIDGGTTQTFLMKVKTTADSAAGNYTATVTVKNGDSTLASSTVTLTVWDFTLSDETPFDTAIDVSSFGVYSEHKMPDGDGGELYRIYYDFMLENRISCYNLPYDILSDEVDAYLDDPRVTSFMIGGDYNGMNTDPDTIRAIYEKLSKNPEWLDKGYFYYVDEPTEMGKLNQLKAAGEMLEELFPGYQMISPYFFNIDITPAEDQITFMSKYITLWCTKVNAWTPTDATGKGVVHMVSREQVEKYGDFASRMAAEVAGGDKSWVYYCWEPDPPYTTFDASRDTIEARIAMWQAMDNDATGLLYFTATEWTGAMWRSLHKTNAGGNIVYGDGILIYPGYRYGVHGPISSLRLETIRDGIEDYMYLDMIKEQVSLEVYNHITDTVSTDVLNWTKDNDLFYANRVAMGNLLETALTGNADEIGFKDTADFVITDEGLVGGVEAGTSVFTLLTSMNTFDGTSITKAGEVLGYGDSVRNGCLIQTESSTLAEIVIMGDADNNGKINLIDASSVMKSIAKWEAAINTTASDVDVNGKLNLADVSVLMKKLAGWGVEFTKNPVRQK